MPKTPSHAVRMTPGTDNEFYHKTAPFLLLYVNGPRFSTRRHYNLTSQRKKAPPPPVESGYLTGATAQRNWDEVQKHLVG
jgi:hypothetical protein